MADSSDSRRVALVIPGVSQSLQKRPNGLVRRAVDDLDALLGHSASDPKEISGDVLSPVTSGLIPEVAKAVPHEQTIEILHELRRKYGGWLRPEIASIRFGQTPHMCFLDICVRESGDNLRDETIERLDLYFIVDGDGEDVHLFFDPKDPIAVNVQRFVNDFDEVGLANCTDILTDEAACAVMRKKRLESDI